MKWDKTGNKCERFDQKNKHFRNWNEFVVGVHSYKTGHDDQQKKLRPGVLKKI